MLCNAAMRCMNVSVDLGVDTVCPSRRSLDDRVPWRLSDICLAIGIDLLRCTNGVERERIWANTNDGSLLRLSLVFNWLEGASISIARTILLMLLEVVKVAVARRGLINRDPVCKSGEEGTGILCQRMECETVVQSAGDDLGCVQGISTEAIFQHKLPQLTKPTSATPASSVPCRMSCKASSSFILTALTAWCTWSSASQETGSPACAKPLSLSHAFVTFEAMGWRGLSAPAVHITVCTMNFFGQLRFIRGSLHQWSEGPSGASTAAPNVSTRRKGKAPPWPLAASP